MTLEQLESRAGRATTHTGGSISISGALRLASVGKALPVVLNDAAGSWPTAGPAGSPLPRSGWP
jgi:hypothetical protein